MSNTKKPQESRVSPEASRRIIQWMFAGDTGVSSETMAAIALNIEKKDTFGYHVPSDASDFGRCYRLVKAVPEIVSAFPYIAKKVPKFAGIFGEWDALCALYEAGTKEKRQQLSNRLDDLALPLGRRAA